MIRKLFKVAEAVWRRRYLAQELIGRVEKDPEKRKARLLEHLEARRDGHAR